MDRAKHDGLKFVPGVLGCLLSRHLEFLHFLKYYQPPGGLFRCRLRIGLALFRIRLRAPSCGKAG
jgi:hypothetical protein